MQHYLARLNCRDGEHEHEYVALIRAHDLDQATAIAQSHAYECGDDDGIEWSYSDNLPLTAYGDGITACELGTVHEIPSEDYEVLKRYATPEINLVPRVASVRGR